jgi:drug/metabolite transporter superfamily protein YnfA
MAVAGTVFTLQGLGFLHGSSMTGVTAWAVLGPIIAIAGLALVNYGRREDVQ